MIYHLYKKIKINDIIDILKENETVYIHNTDIKYFYDLLEKLNDYFCCYSEKYNIIRIAKLNNPLNNLFKEKLIC